MEKNITCFIACGEETKPSDMIEGLRECRVLKIPCSDDTETYRFIAAESHTPYVLVCRAKQYIRLGSRALERMTDYLSAPSCGMVYADRYEETGEGMRPHPVIDYQEGSVRDDFDFGSLVMYRTEALRQAVAEISVEDDYAYSASYAIRLALSRRYALTHIREYLYTEAETDTRRSGEKQFDYVDPRNRSVQIEREAAFTRYLKKDRSLPASGNTPHRPGRRQFPLRSLGHHTRAQPGAHHRRCHPLRAGTTNDIRLQPHHRGQSLYGRDYRSNPPVRGKCESGPPHPRTYRFGHRRMLGPGGTRRPMRTVRRTIGQR